MSEKTNPTEEITTVPAVEAAPAVKSSSGSNFLPVMATLVSVIALGTAITTAALPKTTQPAEVTQASPVDTSALTAQNEALAAQLGALKSQSDALQQRVNQLETALANVSVAAPVASGDTAGLAPIDLLPLQARLTALEARPLPADTASLEAAIAKLQQEIGSHDRTDNAQKTLMVAALQLVTAWQSGQPFEAPWLSALASASLVDPALTLALDDAAPTLLPWRDKGITRLARLTADYPAMAQRVVVAAAPKGESWWQQSLARIKGLVVIRRQGESVTASDEAVDAVLARAEVRLAKADLAGAVEELDKLNDVAAPAAANWLAAAKARLRADALGAKLAQRAATGLLAENPNAPETDEGMMQEGVDNAVPEDLPIEAEPEAVPSHEVTP